MRSLSLVDAVWSLPLVDAVWTLPCGCCRWALPCGRCRCSPPRGTPRRGAAPIGEEELLHGGHEGQEEVGGHGEVLSPRNWVVWYLGAGG
eukprot:6671173-Heterocapsa_arctica.AAC.1